MSHDMLSQIRDYGSQLDEAQAPLTTSEVIDRASVVQTIPQDPGGIHPRPRRGFKAFAFAAGLVVVVALTIVLASIRTDVPPAVTTPTTTPVTPPTTVPKPALSMWPQSSLDEAREAQELADAGDADYTWQLEPDLEENVMWGDFHEQEVPEIFARFLEEELGWEDYAGVGGVGYGSSDFDSETITLTYIRCVPGESDPIYPSEPGVGGCVPTMDGRSYETVEITVARPADHGSSGIWVVVSSEMVEPIEQVVPLTDAEATAILDAFLQTRIDGEGAEQYLAGGDGRVQLLYATTTGASYERFEFELLDDPNWPDGAREFEVRLFAEDGQTVVEQSFGLGRDRTGSWRLGDGSETVENGQVLPILYDILGGEVTFLADQPWDSGLFGPSTEINGEPADNTLVHPEGSMRVLADPLLPMTADCQEGTDPANAETLAQSIQSSGGFEVTAPLTVTIGGAPALQMDVVNVAGANTCDVYPRSAVTRSILEPGHRMRLYLVDLPGGSARILAISVVAPDSSFDSLVEAAAPILDSFEFHTR